MKTTLELVRILNRLINEVETTDVMDDFELVTKYAEEIDELYKENTLPNNPWTSPFPFFPNYPIFPNYPTNPQPYEPNHPWKPIEIWCGISKID